MASSATPASSRSAADGEHMFTEFVHALRGGALSLQQLDYEDSTEQYKPFVDRVDRMTRDTACLARQFHLIETSATSALQECQEIRAGPPLIEKVFDQCYQTKSDEFQALGESRKIVGPILATYQELKTQLYYSCHEMDEVMPDIETFFDDCDRSEFSVGGAVMSLLCPLSKTYFEDPVTSQKCHHSFSRAAIEHVLQNHLSSITEHGRPDRPSGPMKCPVPACPHNLEPEDLVPNKQLTLATKARRLRDQRDQAARDSDLIRL